MDVSMMTNIQELKAAAYDQMKLLEQVQHNLALITTRINELEATAPVAEQTPKVS